MIAKDGETLEIETYRLTFTELADALRRLHGVRWKSLVAWYPRHRPRGSS